MTNTNLTDEAVEGALGQMRTMLAADGYGLDVATAGGQIALTVTAGPDACKECLVPKQVLASIAVDMLTRSEVPVEPADVVLSYPADHESE